MNKRKRIHDEKTSPNPSKKISVGTGLVSSSNRSVKSCVGQRSIQIVTGSYDKVLHGIIANFPSKLSTDTTSPSQVEFQDNFLFSAHSSAIRCLAISPPQVSEKGQSSQKVILASGGTDERINLYHISRFLPSNQTDRLSNSSSPSHPQTFQNPKNRELGSLLHHASSVNVLHFPSRSKLISGADDNTVAVSRTSDWTVLSTIKVPVPRVAGRPSGDTAPLDGAPSGVNDFTIHPSRKLMITLGKGEKCMRLWDLTNGRKAAVLNFERGLLQSLGESRWSQEGRRIQWSSSGSGVAVMFERGAVIFGPDWKPNGLIVPEPPTKLHQIRFLQCLRSNEGYLELIALSTEDGRVLFYASQTNRPKAEAKEAEANPEYPRFPLIGFLGGKGRGLSGRIKDFTYQDLFFKSEEANNTKIVITAASDGAVRLWNVTDAELIGAFASSISRAPANDIAAANGNSAVEDSSTSKIGISNVPNLGVLLGTYETGNRITCLEAFWLQQAQVEQHEQLKQSDTEEEFGGFD